MTMLNKKEGTILFLLLQSHLHSTSLPWHKQANHSFVQNWGATNAHICTSDTKSIPTTSCYGIKKMVRDTIWNLRGFKRPGKRTGPSCVLINACVMTCWRSGDKHSSKCAITSLRLQSRTALRDFSTIHTRVIGTYILDVFPMINTWIILLQEEVLW